jgi:hypothetical protein
MMHRKNTLGNYRQSSSKKVKKTGGKKVSSTLNQLIEELLTDVPVPIAGENLEEVSENGVSIFLQLSNRIDNARSYLQLF